MARQPSRLPWHHNVLTLTSTLTPTPTLTLTLC